MTLPVDPFGYTSHRWPLFTEARELTDPLSTYFNVCRTRRRGSSQCVYKAGSLLLHIIDQEHVEDYVKNGQCKHICY